VRGIVVLKQVEQRPYDLHGEGSVGEQLDAVGDAQADSH
jgi:hypothetical protein